MGAWTFMEPRLQELLPDTCVLHYAGRDEAASPAVGSFRLHEVQERALVEGALDTKREPVPECAAEEGDGAAMKQATRGVSL
jgi:2-oxoglutarate dehydrogenase E1 component